MEIILILAIVLGTAGGYIYRARGKNEHDVPKFLKSRLVRRLGCGAVMGIAAVFAGGHLLEIFNTWGLNIPLNEILNYSAVILSTMILAFYGIIVGHGSYFPRFDGSTNDDNEAFSVITKMVASPLNEKARFVGMSLTGLAMTIPIAFIPGVAWWYAGVGILKAVVYVIGAKLPSGLPSIFPRETEFGEWGWGFVYVSLLCLA